MKKFKFDHISKRPCTQLDHISTKQLFYSTLYQAKLPRVETGASAKGIEVYFILIYLFWLSGEYRYLLSTK